MSNLTAILPLNDSITSPVVQVAIGGQTVNSSYFTRQTVPIPLPNGTRLVVHGPLMIRGPVVYYEMENAGRKLQVTLWLENGDRLNLTFLAESWVLTYLRVADEMRPGQCHSSLGVSCPSFKESTGASCCLPSINRRTGNVLYPVRRNRNQ